MVDTFLFGTTVTVNTPPWSIFSLLLY